MINSQKKTEVIIKLQVDPCSADRGTNELPMTLYELEANGGLLQKKFVMEAKEAERVNRFENFSCLKIMFRRLSKVWPTIILVQVMNMVPFYDSIPRYQFQKSI